MRPFFSCETFRTLLRQRSSRRTLAKSRLWRSRRSRRCSHIAFCQICVTRSDLRSTHPLRHIYPIRAHDDLVPESQLSELLGLALRRRMKCCGQLQITTLIQEPRNPLLQPLLLQRPRLQHAPRRDHIRHTRLPTHHRHLMQLPTPNAVNMHQVKLIDLKKVGKRNPFRFRKTGNSANTPYPLDPRFAAVDRPHPGVHARRTFCGHKPLHRPRRTSRAATQSRDDMKDFHFLFLKYSIVFARPSCSGTFGSQPFSSAFASVMSGLRFFGSSDGSGL